MSYQQAPTGTFSSTLIWMFEKNVRYSTVIDVGCADGHFFAVHKVGGLFPKAVPFNVDANVIYEESLKAIKDAAGGAYFIGAATDFEGEIDMIDSAHPYWNSVVPENDPYWKKINHTSGTKIKISAATLDSLVKRFKLKPPYLLKLDVQGGEPAVLRGATDVLEETHAVICEVDIDDFPHINTMLVERGFVLFDLTQMNWLADRSLGWFYPVYVKRKLARFRQKTMWAEKDHAAVLQLQVQRRKDILQHNRALVAQLRAQSR